MNRRAILIILTLALLIAGVLFGSLSSASFFPDPGPDLPRIYIRSDGSVQPATAPIERTGNLYTLTSNVVLYTIEIQRDNIVLDGAGYSILGNANRIKGYDDGNNGVIVNGRNNVNITRLNCEQGDTGIRISGSSQVKVVDNSFSNSLTRGIVVKDSMLVLIENNDFTDIYGDYPAISINGSKNTVKNNILSGSIRGITIEGQSNIISDNRIESLLPIIMDKADSTLIARNTITGPVSSSYLPDQNYKGNEGIALFVSCSNNMITGNNISGFINQAIRIVFSCYNNTFYANYMGNNEFAIALQEGAVNNTFYGNTFSADSCKIQIDDGVEGVFWDNGTIGNYWGDYNGTDSDGNGIGDVPYMVLGYKWDIKVEGFVSVVYNQDNYPLMSPFEIPSAPTPSPEPQPEPFPTTLVTATAVALVAVVGVGLLFYFNKHKR
jgi:parallel beta-helix repeat protein